MGERGRKGAAKSSSKNSGEIRKGDSLMIKSRSWVISAWNPNVSAMVVEE